MRRVFVALELTGSFRCLYICLLLFFLLLFVHIYNCALNCCAPMFVREFSHKNSTEKFITRHISKMTWHKYTGGAIYTYILLCALMLCAMDMEKTLLW